MSFMGGFRRGFPKIIFRNKSFSGDFGRVFQKSDSDVFRYHRNLTILESECFSFRRYIEKNPDLKVFRNFVEIPTLYIPQNQIRRFFGSSEIWQFRNPNVFHFGDILRKTRFGFFSEFCGHANSVSEAWHLNDRSDSEFSRIWLGKLQKNAFFSGPATKALSPRPSIISGFFFRASKKGFFS